MFLAPFLFVLHTPIVPAWAWTLWLLTLCSAFLQWAHTPAMFRLKRNGVQGLFFNINIFYLLVSQWVVLLALVARIRISHRQFACLLIDIPELPRVSFQQFIKSIADSTKFNLLKLKTFIYLTQDLQDEVTSWTSLSEFLTDISLLILKQICCDT